MKKLASTEVRGKSGTWVVHWHASDEQIADMQADGIEVFVTENSIPMWVNDLGMTRPWCFVQDVFNFRNPFGK